MPTTPRGIIYPDSSGHTRLWDWLQQLATSTDTAIGNAMPSDTGWQPITLGSGWAGTSRARRIGFAVYMTGSPVRASGTNGTIGNLPAGMFPPGNIAMLIRNGTTALPLGITSAGALNISSGYTNGVSANLDSVAAFLIN